MNKRKKILYEGLYILIMAAILVLFENIWIIKDYQAIIMFGIGWFGCLLWDALFGKWRKHES